MSVTSHGTKLHPSNTDAGSMHVIKLLQQRTWPWAILAAVLTFVAYLPTLEYKFVWDDFEVIVENPYLREWRYAPRYFVDGKTFSAPRASGAGVYAYRPLRNIEYLIEYKLYGIHPGFMHLVNVLHHAAAAGFLVVFLGFVLRFFYGVPPVTLAHRFCAFAPAMIWAWHPVNSEVVAWVKGRDDILCVIFVLGALITFLRATERREPGYRWVAPFGALYALALGSKEMALALPLMIGGIPLFYHKRIFARKTWCALIATVLSVSVLYFWLRWIALGTVKQVPYVAGSFSAMMATMVRAAIRYLQLSVWPLWPIRQNADYAGFPLSNSWRETSVAASGAILLAILAGGIWLVRRNKMAVWGAWIFAVAMAPVANIIPMMQVLAERFLYLPLIGAALIVSALLDRLLSGRRATFCGVVAVCYLALLCILLERRLPVWRTDAALQRDSYEADPSNWRAAYTYGITLVNAGETTQAASIARSNRLERDNPWIYVLSMRVSVAEGRTTEAIQALEEATSLQPKAVAKYWADLASRLAHAGDLKSAEKCLVRAAQLEPATPSLWRRLAEIRAKQNDAQGAEQALQKYNELSTGANTLRL